MEKIDRAFKDLFFVICKELRIPLIVDKLNIFDKFLKRHKNRIEEEFVFFWENWNFLIVMGGLIVGIGLLAFWRVCR